MKIKMKRIDFVVILLFFVIFSFCLYSLYCLKMKEKFDDEFRYLLEDYCQERGLNFDKTYTRVFTDEFKIICVEKGKNVTDMEPYSSPVLPKYISKQVFSREYVRRFGSSYFHPNQSVVPVRVVVIWR